MAVGRAPEQGEPVELDLATGRATAKPPQTTTYPRTFFFRRLATRQGRHPTLSARSRSISQHPNLSPLGWRTDGAACAGL